MNLGHSPRAVRFAQAVYLEVILSLAQMTETVTKTYMLIKVSLKNYILHKVPVTATDMVTGS